MSFTDKHLGLVSITTVLLVLGTIGFLGNEYTKYQCNQYERLTGIQTEYSNWDTCYVQLEGTYTRWDEYLERVKASELMKGSQ